LSRLKNQNLETKKYYVLRFNKTLDVLNLEKTLFVKGTDHIIKPVFSLLKINLLNIFCKPSSYNLWKISSGLYVSEKLKKDIQINDVTGVVFEKTSVL
jgi:hypothetical protein